MKKVLIALVALAAADSVLAYPDKAYYEGLTKDQLVQLALQNDGVLQGYKETVTRLNTKIQHLGLMLKDQKMVNKLKEGMRHREGVHYPRVRILDVMNDNKGDIAEWIEDMEFKDIPPAVPARKKRPDVPDRFFDATK